MRTYVFVCVFFISFLKKEPDKQWGNRGKPQAGRQADVKHRHSILPSQKVPMQILTKKCSVLQCSSIFAEYEGKGEKNKGSQVYLRIKNTAEDQEGKIKQLMKLIVTTGNWINY